MTSLKVTKGFFANNSLQIQDTAARMGSLCSARQGASNDIYDDLRSRDLRSTFDLDLSRSTCICFDADRLEDHDGAISLFLAGIL